jgi:hypothetical protein
MVGSRGGLRVGGKGEETKKEKGDIRQPTFDIG